MSYYETTVSLRFYRPSGKTNLKPFLAPPGTRVRLNSFNVRGYTYSVGSVVRIYEGSYKGWGRIVHYDDEICEVPALEQLARASD